MKTAIYIILLAILTSCNSSRSRSVNIELPLIDSTIIKAEQAAPDTIVNIVPKEIFVTDGYSRLGYDGNKNEEATKRFEKEMEFVVLKQEGNVFTIKPTKVKAVFSINDCTGQDEVVLYVNGSYDYTALISGLEVYNTNEIPNVLPKERVALLPGKDFTFTTNGITYALHATADWEDDIYCSSSYKLYFKSENKNQLIASIDQLADAMPGIYFIGDIDRDGLPDLLLDEASHYEDYCMVLYLSSYAASDCLVMKVAVNQESRDC